MAQEILEYLAGVPQSKATFNLNFERYSLVKKNNEGQE